MIVASTNVYTSVHAVTRSTAVSVGKSGVNRVPGITIIHRGRIQHVVLDIHM